MAPKTASVYDTPPRDDLQGLRAIAVLAVILYHSHVPGFSGGYVGVDAFFVLSGFLITRKLFRELDRTKSLDLLSFVGDRSKRLIPNAGLVILTTLLASVILLPAYRHANIAADARAAAMFYSNFHFAAQAVDYLRLSAPPSPFMHFWSLSIEEQFYVLFPTLLACGAFAAGSRTLAMAKVLLAAVFIVSFGLMLWAIQDSQPAAFFHTQNRIWQLAAGGLVGATFQYRLWLPLLARSALAYAGLLLVLWAIATYSDDLIYPGLPALMPTVGTALLLYGLDAKGAAPASRILASPPMTWIGDRSYSLYLWHWPILVLTNPHSWLAVAGCILLIAVCSAAAYKYVERPLHRATWPKWRKWQRAVVGLGLSLTVFAATFLLTAVPTVPVAAGRTAEIEAASSDFGANYDDGCHLSFEATATEPCYYGSPNGAQIVALFGDSHAAQWFAPIERAAVEAGWRFRTITKTSCPSAEVAMWFIPTKSLYEECNIWRADAMRELLANPPDIVVIANSSRYSGWLYDGRLLYGDEAATEWMEGLERTVRLLLSAGSKVVLIRDNPKLFVDFRDCLSHSDDCARPRSDALEGLTDDNRVAQKLGGGVQVLDFTDQLCTADECPATIDDQIVYQDEHHLTATFTATLWRRFFDLLDQSVR